MAGDGNPQPVFGLYEAAAIGPQPEVLGLWTPQPLSPGDAVSFAAVPKATDQGPVWRASYPPDPDQAARLLDEAEEKLEASRAALAASPARLDAYVARGPAGVAFGLPTGDAVAGQPESDLALLLVDMQRGAPAVDFGLGDQLAARWEEAVQAFEGFMEQVQQIMGHYAWVETRLGGRLVGQTAVTWTGDVDSVLLDRLASDQLGLHQRTLRLALESRRTMLRTSSLVLTYAVKLSVLLATPGGIALAIPAVLRFIHQMRMEIERHQRIKKEV